MKGASYDILYTFHIVHAVHMYIVVIAVATNIGTVSLPGYICTRLKTLGTQG